MRSMFWVLMFLPRVGLRDNARTDRTGTSIVSLVNQMLSCQCFSIHTSADFGVLFRNLRWFLNKFPKPNLLGHVWSHMVGHQASMNSPGQGPAIFQLPALHKLPPKPVLQFIPKFNICIACVRSRSGPRGLAYPHTLFKRMTPYFLQKEVMKSLNII